MRDQEDGKCAIFRGLGDGDEPAIFKGREGLDARIVFQAFKGLGPDDIAQLALLDMKHDPVIALKSDCEHTFPICEGLRVAPAAVDGLTVFLSHRGEPGAERVQTFGPIRDICQQPVTLVGDRHHSGTVHQEAGKAAKVRVVCG